MAIIGVLAALTAEAMLALVLPPPRILFLINQKEWGKFVSLNLLALSMCPPLSE